VRVPRIPIVLPLVAAAFVLVYLSRFPLQRFTQLAGSTFRFRENLWLWLLVTGTAMGTPHPACTAKATGSSTPGTPTPKE